MYQVYILTLRYELYCTVRDGCELYETTALT